MRYVKRIYDERLCKGALRQDARPAANATGADRARHAAPRRIAAPFRHPAKKAGGGPL